MIVHDLNVLDISAGPAEAHAKLVIDADAVLTGTLAFHCLKAVGGWNPEIIQGSRPVQHRQLAQRHRLQIHKPFHTCTLEQGFRLRAFEGFDRHQLILSHFVSIVSR